MVLMIDNYDSFTYNLVQYFQELNQQVVVYRNDAIDLAGIVRLKASRVVISPGPGRPQDAGISCAVIRALYTTVPILGVCLGHQCIGYAFGAKIIRAPEIMHGKTSLVYHTGSGIFKNVKNPFTATRYHSLVIDKKTVPTALTITARTRTGVIMGVREKRYPLWGVQFHPESILTGEGKKILANFLRI
ncbi:MAG: aminodeoxychorismate/anthranilate synthase component II [Candidatus Omnitrophota bacterium]|nr:aminodeoxychorismate/anthranilate synthase component II [Candidatus Omnitrophota bacterium]